MLMLVSACAEPLPSDVSPEPEVSNVVIKDGTRYVPKIFRITAEKYNQIPYRVLDSINVVRNMDGLEPVRFSSELNAAAFTHARDMSVQNRPWHFGSDGSSPLDRARRAGFDGELLGEVISETYEGDLDTIAAWLDEDRTREPIMIPEARVIGLGWYQEERGKIWWTLIVGA